jgi:membrane protease YdiL (CAAX protease family)
LTAGPASREAVAVSPRSKRLSGRTRQPEPAAAFGRLKALVGRRVGSVWRRDPEPGNAFGLVEAMLGLLIGFALDILAVGVYLPLSGHPHDTNSLGVEISALIGLWIGLVGSVVYTSRAHRGAGGRALGSDGVTAGEQVARAPRRVSTGKLSLDFGFNWRPAIDVPLGIAIGVASQFLLVPLLELPLVPFVPHLYKQLGKPAQQLTSNVSGVELVVLALFICIGSPIVEELFFRGLLLRSLLGRFATLGRTLGPLISIAVTAVVFGLVHFEALQFLGLAGFGAVLSVLAWRSGRLGPCVVAHASFNCATVIALALSR